MSSKIKPTEGRTVTFKPSETTLDRKFRNKRKKTYPAVITDVNKDSVDLTVHGVGETVYISNVPHATDTKEERSSWDWPVFVKDTDEPKE